MGAGASALRSSAVRPVPDETEVGASDPLVVRKGRHWSADRSDVTRSSERTAA